MFLPLREINLDGMLVDPAAVLLVVCGVLFLLLRTVTNRFLDLNRFVWRRPLVDIALMVILYSAAILSFRPI
jgi:uncharacterized membrane protein YbhN (UPF0104 family)